MAHITTIGGGTGSFTVLTGLKRYSDVSLSAIVSMADSGGSTGRLRDEFGYLPVGDVRQALAALADQTHDRNLLRELFLHRFEKGEEGLRGHNVGNLLLVALTDILGSEEEAIAYASSVLRVSGSVVPVTTDNVTLEAAYADGTNLSGETNIDEPPANHDSTQRITKLEVAPQASINARAKEAIAQSDCIVLGPGDLYTSTLANVVIAGVPEALQKTNATLIYVVNLMSKYGQTHGFTARDHVEELTRYTGREPDATIINATDLPADVLERYEAECEYPVHDDLGSGRGVIRADLLAEEVQETQAGDTLKRSLIRHDPDKLAAAIMSA